MKTDLLAFSMLFVICLFCKQIGAQDIMINGHSKYTAHFRMPETPPQDYETILSSSILDTIYSFPAPGILPTGITWDGQYLWHIDSGLDSIYKLTTTGIVIRSFPYMHGGGDLSWDGNNLWLVDEQPATLFKIDTATGLAVNQFSLPSSGQGDPNGWGISWDGQYLWHSEYSGTAMIYRLDPQNGQVVDSFPPPVSNILGITWVNGFLYGATTTDHLLYKFDPTTGAVLDTESWQLSFALGMTWDGQYFWNADNSKNRIYQISSSLTSIHSNVANKPGSFALSQNYPNPFNPTTNINYQLPVSGEIELTIYNLLGQQIRTLINSHQPAGTHRVQWDGGDESGKPVTSGVYFYQLKTGKDYSETKKMVLMR